MDEISYKAQEAADWIRQKSGSAPRVGVILGSGLGAFAREVAGGKVMPYGDIPHFPVPTVPGHEGNLVVGELSGVPLAVMQGRFHHYEGYFMREVSFPVRVMHELGAGTLIVTNAAGGMGDAARPGAFMAVSDHINMMGTNPLSGLEMGDGRERFVDLTSAYDASLIDIAMSVARDKGIEMFTGVLAAMPGPCYETPAEVRMLKTLGADAVCMSTVPEVIMARYLGMKVLAISLITNVAAGLSEKGPEHSEVLDMAGSRQEQSVGLLAGIVARLKDERT